MLAHVRRPNGDNDDGGAGATKVICFIRIIYDVRMLLVWRVSDNCAAV